MYVNNSAFRAIPCRKLPPFPSPVQVSLILVVVWPANHFYYLSATRLAGSYFFPPAEPGYGTQERKWQLYPFQPIDAFAQITSALKSIPAFRAWGHRSFVCNLYCLPSLMKCVPHWRNSKDTFCRMHCSRKESTQS